MTRLTGVFCCIFVGVACAMAVCVDSVSANNQEDAVVKNTNLLRLEKTNSCPDCNLSGLNLNKLDLRGADLQGADLRNAKMHLVNLAGADLRDTLLEGAVMVGADLAKADLRGAMLGARSLDGAYVVGALLDEQRPDANKEAIAENAAEGSVNQVTGAGELVTVRSEEEVPMVKTTVKAPTPKKLSPIRTATLRDPQQTIEEPDAQPM
ncbi:pentapeptide repeat-containing protein [Desulfosediminicola sp.]|uniref:pentapeptide repeat-containing protein n=1 Tax=Desulfosediminicola sp. TaxID=2886825 RepID=UPI003AF304AF